MMFVECDADKDGKLNKEELKKFLDLCEIKEEERPEFVSKKYKNKSII